MTRSKDLSGILELAEGLERTAALAEWVQALYEDDLPVLVGGAAVELYSGGSYTSGDLDFVGEVPRTVAARLRGAGFEKRGRHWIHEGGVFVEFPASSLEPHERVTTLRSAGHHVLTLSPEDVLVDRLTHWQIWGSTIDALNAWTLWRLWSEELDRERLDAASRARKVTPALGSLERFAASLAGSDPGEEDLERWASQRPR